MSIKTDVRTVKLSENAIKAIEAVLSNGKRAEVVLTPKGLKVAKSSWETVYDEYNK